MNKDRWIGNSRRLYTRLLAIYPKKHVEEYGTSMVQVFTDQCRAAYQQNYWFGLLMLWVRTIFDLCKTAVHEHLYSKAKDGLMAAFPGAPLPWKKLVLVLLPGLVILLAYMLAALKGNFSYYSQSKWAVIFSSIIVILVWWRTKRFPVWGLIPYGLFVNAFISLIYNYSTAFGTYAFGSFIVSAIIILTISCLLYLHARRYKLSRAAWFWLGLFTLTCIGRLVIAYLSTVETGQWNWHSLFFPHTGEYIPIYFGDAVYQCIKLLLVIFLGTLLARRYGSLAILFLLAPYLTSGIIIFSQSQYYFFYLLRFTYCLCIAIVFPTWIARSNSVIGQTKVITILVVFELIMDIMNDLIFDQGWFLFPSIGAHYSPIQFGYTIVSSILVGVGFFLAISLYRSTNSVPENVNEPGIPETIRV